MTTVELPSQASSDSQSPFDDIRQVRADGSEFWSARAIQVLMGYVKWQRFEDAIARAKVSTANCGRDADAEFLQVVQLTDAGNLGVQERKDYELSRYAAYTLAMNGEPSKPEVALAQGYFINQTWFAEAVQSSPALLAATTEVPRSLSAREVGTLYADTLSAYKATITAATVESETAHALAYSMQEFARLMSHMVKEAASLPSLDAVSTGPIEGAPAFSIDGPTGYLAPYVGRSNGAASEGSRLPDFIFLHEEETHELITWAKFAASKGLPRCGRCGQGMSRRIMYAATSCGTSRGRINGHNVFPLPVWEMAWELHEKRYTERHNDPARNHNGDR